MEIYLQSGEEQTGPYGEAELCALVTSGRVMRSDLAWREGQSGWLPLEQVVTLPPRPIPPPVPKRMPAASIAEPSFPAGLPPLPPKAPTRPTAPVLPASARSSATTVRTASGIIALILALLTIFNVGGCMNTSAKLTKFQRGDSAIDTANMFVDTFRGASQGDPMRGVSGMLDKAQSLQDDYESSRLGAWLCLIGTAVAGGVYRFAGPPKSGVSTHREI